MITLEELVRSHVDEISPAHTHEFRMVARIEGERVVVYLHPMNVNGVTLDFYVEGNSLIEKR